MRWFRHLTTALPLASAEAVPSPEEGEEEEPLLIVLANEYWDALPARQFQLTCAAASSSWDFDCALTDLWLCQQRAWLV